MTKFICLFLAVIICRTEAVPEYHRVIGHYGERLSAYEDVMVDKEANLVVATVAQITSKRVTPSIAFHDFNAGYSAIKLVEKGVCFIERTRHDLEYLMRVLDQAENDNGDYEIRQTFKCTSKTFVNQADLDMYGERIAAFCREYESFYVEKDYQTRSKRDVRALGSTSMWCFICGGDCDVERKTSI